MELFWSLVTVAVVIVVAGAWVFFAVRGQLMFRAERAKPEDAAALREIQRQIDAGYTYSARDGMDRNF